ncbi:hypothetical protein ACFIQF_07895 [Comamonas sp. J-3]
MKLIASITITKGREKHRLIPCGFQPSKIEISYALLYFSTLGVMEELQRSDALRAPRQFIYLHQTGVVPSLRTWLEWLSEGRSRDVEGDLIGMTDARAQERLTDALQGDWDVLPPGYSQQCATHQEAQP